MEQHLNDGQVEDILRFGSSSANRLDDALVHLRSCEICRKRVEREKASMERLAQVRPQGVKPRNEGCPYDEIWIQIAGGMVSSETEAHLDHAAQCDHCGPQLRRAVAEFATDLTPLEEIQVATLTSSTPGWQSLLAKRLAQLNPEAPRKRPTIWRPVLKRIGSPPWNYSVVSGIVAIVFAVALAWHWRGHSASQSQLTDDLPTVHRLLAESYGERRTSLFRVPGATHVPFDPTMGSIESDIDLPMPFLQAETSIKASLQKHPGDPDWLEARARADVLKWHFSSAIKTLSVSIAANPTSTPIQLDLAAAYFESGRSGEKKDYARSIDLLKTVLQREPDNTIALFNLAIVCEADNDPNCAKESWHRYLLLDPKGDWADEAREHLANVSKTTTGRFRRDGERLLTETQFATSVKANQEEAWRLVDPRIEDYSEKALTEWIPDLDVYSTSHPAASLLREKDGLQTLSVILERRHRDRFLVDFLRGIGRPTFSRAVEYLRDSMLANAHGDPALALTKAQYSEALFLKASNTAGILRARFEQVYAMQFLESTNKCIDESHLSFVAADVRGYSWLATQFSLEEAFCSNISGKPGVARKLSQRADEEARNAHYEDLRLRAVIGLAAIDSESGSISNAWNLSSDGLRAFWSGTGSPTRGYSFYVLQDALADEDQFWHFDTVVINEALQFMPQILDPLVEASIRYRSAEAYLRLGEPSLAEEQLRLAQELLDKAPQTDANTTERLTGTIELAQVEDGLGHYARSLELLHLASKITERGHEIFDTLEYFRTLGQSSLKLGQLQTAREAFGSAIKVCESGASTLTSARDRLSWIRACMVPYYAVTELDFKAGAANEAFSTYQRFRRVTMNTLLGADMSTPMVLKKSASRTRGSHGDRFDTEAQEIGREHSATVTYVTFDDGLLIWTHESRGSSVRWINVTRTELGRVASRFLAECEQPSADITDLRRDAGSLYQWLIAPIQGSLESIDQLVIQPDSPIANIPYEALVRPDNSFLGDHFSLVISPGGDRTRRRQSVGSLINRPALIFDSDYFDPKSGLLPLEGTKREVLSIGSFLNHPSFLIGNAATQNALESYLPKAAIFHYVGHSRIDLGGNRLLLRSGSQDPPFVSWGAANISPTLFRQCELAVLSACSTANGEQGEWLNRESLVFALIAAGVPRVIASHWNVDSNTTSLMMDAFYRHLRDEPDVSVALQQAQTEVRRNSATSCPFYWAAFSVFGTP